MIKIFLFLLIAYGVYRLFMNDRRKKSEVEKKQNEQRVVDGELVKDPECGTYIEADSAITVREGSRVYHFCSYECRDKFLAKRKKITPDTPDGAPRA